MGVDFAAWRRKLADAGFRVIHDDYELKAWPLQKWDKRG